MAKPVLALARNIARWLETPLSGFVLGSGNGEEPALCMEIVRLGYQERFSDGRPLQAVASSIDSVIIRYGVAGVKAALDLLGFEGMRPRAPSPAATDDRRQEIGSVLRGTGLLG